MKLIIDDIIEDNDKLLLTSNCITGFRIRLGLTSDNVVIVINSDLSFNNLTFKEIKKSTNLYTFKEILELFKNYQKELILTISNMNDPTNLFIDLILV